MSNSIGRGVKQPLAVHLIETINDYVQYLQQTPLEVDAFFQDISEQPNLEEKA
ncbi:MAG: hypothetical protein HQM08_00825 [Candidatus Riflebacteria bacterium]|nr:hypothetical protein [Candidatus Riflebacteria bacterium]